MRLEQNYTGRRAARHEPRCCAHLRRRASDERGAALIFVAVGLPVFVAFGIFVIDVGNWWVHKRHLQTQADAAALAGAREFRFPACNDQDDRRGGGRLLGRRPLRSRRQLHGVRRPRCTTTTSWPRARARRPDAGSPHAGQHARPVQPRRTTAHRSTPTSRPWRRRPQAVHRADGRREDDGDGLCRPFLTPALPERARLHRLHRRARARRAPGAGGRRPACCRSRSRTSTPRGSTSGSTTRTRRSSSATRSSCRDGNEDGLLIYDNSDGERRHADPRQLQPRDDQRPGRDQAAHRRRGRVQRQRLDQLRRPRRAVLRHRSRRRDAHPRLAHVRGHGRPLRARTASTTTATARWTRPANPTRTAPACASARCRSSRTQPAPRLYAAHDNGYFSTTCTEANLAVDLPGSTARTRRTAPTT